MLNKLLTITGEVLITLGVLVGGFVLWQQIHEHQIAAGQDDVAHSLISAWEQQPHLSIEELAQEMPDLGKGFAVIEIPRFGEKWKKVIAEGIGFDVLNDKATGVGHYPSTAMPGEEGNFAISAHRLGNGGPFLDMDQIREGDEVRVTTGSVEWVYTVNEIFLVKPHQVEVLDATPGKYEITMTTCHPMYQWHERMIVKGELTSKIENGVETEFTADTEIEVG